MPPKAKRAAAAPKARIALRLKAESPAVAPKAKSAAVVPEAGHDKRQDRGGSESEGPERKMPRVSDPPEVAPLRYSQRHPRPENALDGWSESNVPAVNTKFTKDFEEVMAKVLDTYENVDVLPALTEDEGSLGATFSQTHFQAAMETANSYSFFGSLFLHDLRWRPLPGTPINSRAVHAGALSWWPGPPQRFSFELVIVADNANHDVMAGFGTYHRISTVLSGC